MPCHCHAVGMWMRMQTRLARLLIAAGAALSLAGCGGSSGMAVSQGEPSAPAAWLAAAPTDADLSEVQGFSFQDALAPQASTADDAWVADAADDRARQAGVDAVAQVDPAGCEAIALMAGYGLTSARSEPTSLTAVGFSARRSNSGQAYPTEDSVDTWQSTAYQLPPGQADRLAASALDAWAACSAFTLVDADGQRRQGERAHNLTAERGWQVSGSRSGRAFIRTALLDGPVGAQLMTVLEPIGDVLYVTRIGIWSKEPAVWQRASRLYNRLADQVAMGASRDPVELTAG